MTRAKSYASWEKSLKAFAYRQCRLNLWYCPSLKTYSQAGESEGDFRVRLQQAAREQRDLRIEKLRKTYAPKLRSLQDRIRRAEQRVQREQSQYSHSKMAICYFKMAQVLKRPGT